MARILWMSDAPDRPSGFGLVTRELCGCLQRRGHAVTVLGWWTEGARPPTDDLNVIACPVSPESCIEELREAIQLFQPDVLVTLGDVPWVYYLAQQSVRDMLDASGISWLIYYPVDGTLPDGSLREAWVPILAQADQRIAMSMFGVQSSARSEIDAAYVPHGCDEHLFRPPPDKHAVKRRFDLDRKFVILSDARNHRRKLLPRLLDIVKAFASGKDDVALLLNTNIVADAEHGAYLYDLQTDIDILGLRDMVKLANTHSCKALTMDEVASLYQASDVHLLCSWGEGFGLPTLQAAAAGVPTVAGGFSATKELVQRCGIIVEDAGTVVDEFGIVRHFIDRESAVRALESLYSDDTLRSDLSAKSVAYAGALTWDVVAMKLESIVASCERRTGSNVPQQWSLSHVARPTGHDATFLPTPTITVPVRHAVRTPRAAPIVVTSSAFSRELAPLVRLFPGLLIEDCAPDDDLGSLLDSNAVVLVVDPEGQLEVGADLRCALARVSFIGPSAYWTQLNGDTLLLQARLVLTDHPLAAARWNHAHELAQARQSV